ncbi:large subunit ribosomal protein L18e [Nematocida displodere]|uniref:Large subunit ribosomal protein L18e n=1 Tax=Nematocida displodere TaxID=1805483 RepID=A0A177ECF6_9MICR|nr:large subunit ribosomal protein L18e [Nematocida displodere]
MTDKKVGKIRGGRKAPKTQNAEVQSLFELFKKVSEKTTHPEYRKIANHLKKPRSQRPVVTLKKLVAYTAPCAEKIAVVVAKIVGEDSIVEIPHKINVACLDISVSAKAKIEKFGGQVYKLDEIFRVAPNPEHMVIFQGPSKARKANRYFGVPGSRHAPARPRVISKGSERKKARVY